MAFAVAVVLPAAAFACTCIPPPPPATAFGSSDAVFLGVAHATTVGPTFEEWTLAASRGHPFVFERFEAFSFDVRRSWKGVERTSVVVMTGRGGGDCGYAFVEGEEYVVYAWEALGRLRTSICTRTRPSVSAAADLGFLSSQSTLTPKSPTPPSGDWGFAVPVGLLLLPGAWLAWWIRLRTRKRVAPQPKAG